MTANNRTEESTVEKMGSTDEDVGTDNDLSFWIESEDAYNREAAERFVAETQSKDVFRAITSLKEDVRRGVRNAVRDAVIDSDTLDALARQAYLERNDQRGTARRLGREWALERCSTFVDLRRHDRRFEERKLRHGRSRTPWLRRDARFAKESWECSTPPTFMDDEFVWE